MIIKEVDKRILFLLLFVYSVLPGLYKLVGNQVIMLLNLPIIGFLLFQKSLFKISKFDGILLFFVAYIILHTVVFTLSPFVNATGSMMGFYMYVIPISGFFISRKISFEIFSQIIIKIALIHFVFGILLYPPFGIYLILQNTIPNVEVLKEGVAFGRMASCSGSLGFGNLMMMGTICSFFFNKKLLPLLLIGLIFSAQRSSWVAVLLVMLLSLFETIKSSNINFSFKHLVGFSSVLLLVPFIAIYLDLDLTFIFSRFSKMGNAAGERTQQWAGAFENFIFNPIGAGVGQVGQIAARYEPNSLYNVCPDGDYFRVLSETGIVGGLFILFVIFSAIIIISTSKINNINNRAKIGLLFGCLIQMVGSNISEFYFNNFLYWCVFGYYFLFLNSKFVLSKKMFV